MNSQCKIHVHVYYSDSLISVLCDGGGAVTVTEGEEEGGGEVVEGGGEMVEGGGEDVLLVRTVVW